MSWDTCPTLAGYIAFLYGSVGIKPAVLPLAFQGAGTTVEGSTTLTIVGVQSGSLLPGAIVYDANAAIGPGISILTQLTGFPPAGQAGTYQMSGAAGSTSATAEAITAPNVDMVGSFCLAMDTVNDWLSVSGRIYTEAVYNLATDRLFNYAADVPGQTFFQDSRGKMRLLEPAVGVTTSASDEGTAGTLMNPEYLKLLTLDDLQTLKTPWGRRYLGIAQSAGPVVWGLS